MPWPEIRCCRSLPLALGAGPEGIGLAVGISTVTGILFKMPSGALSDIIGRRRTMLAGLVVFGLMPFAYLFITDYAALVVVRFLHGLATAIYGPVAMAVVADIAGARKGEMLSWFSSVGIAGTLLGAPIGGYLLFLLGEGTGRFERVIALFFSVVRSPARLPWSWGSSPCATATNRPKARA